VIADLGLTAALRQLVTHFRENGVEVSFVERDLQPEPGLEVSTALYRITQESLRNVQKHAREAAVRVLFAANGDAFHLTIEDSGPGFDLETVRKHGGLGLVSMQERARLVGGTLRIRTGMGEGTLILVRVPMNHQ
jgi:two-component system CheB/CheR fusion protein